MSHPAHSPGTRHPQGPPEPDRRRWIALAVLSVAQFMLIVDVTVVNVALPSIGTDLHLDRETLTWVVTAYTLVFGGLMVLGGRLADAFGALRVLYSGVAVFTLASLVTGLAGDGGLLLGGRVAQGTGAALLSPAALSIITTTFHGADRDRALGVWAALGGIGAAAGVLLGGALTAGPGWAWVFFVNVPVGLAVLVALPMVVRASPRPAVPGRIDLPGALLVTGGTAALIYGLVKAGDAGWSGATTLISLAVAAALYAGFAVVERAVRSPLMDLRLLARRPVVTGAFLMLVATALLIGMFFLGSLYLQRIQGYGALKTGLTFLPVAIGTGAGAHLAGRSVGRRGCRPIAVAGLVSATAGFGLLAGLDAHSDPYTVLLPGFVLVGVGVGAVFVAATTTALGFVPQEEAGLASGLISTFHEVGGSVGVAVVSTVAATGLRAGTVTGFGTAFTVAAITAGVAAVVAVAVAPAGRPRSTGGPFVH